ncbi:MAG: cysteine--tRNA ligase [Defluviitaleaceae bacterium]|nr:cysteine--tRNA ligase [Defluviitaleaceae bacterium]
MKIYNTMTRTKENFSAITPGKIKMYTCGQTVYNDIHMGNARFYVVFDAIRRYLIWRGYDVNFVQNFTDIDDKIIAKAIEENCTTEEIAERYIAHTLEDLSMLNCLPATTNPRATQEIPEIITLISSLIEKNYAYENNGTVYYDVNKFEKYGKLSKKKTEDLEAGARIEVEAGKRNPMDFVLWKPAKKGEPAWQSPWGDGRPGWHIECSAMAKKYLGDEIDIHGGAEDLIFPHHENEIAQTEAITGQEFARFWMHCGILTTDHKKMSKSRGNFFTFREMTEKFSPDVIRFYLLSGHYKMPMEFNNEVLKAAGQGLQRIKTCYANLQHALTDAENGVSDLTDTSVYKESLTNPFTRAMDDDFNTADAITAIFELVKFINTQIAEARTTTHKRRHIEFEGQPEIIIKTLSRELLIDLREMLENLCEILGIKIKEPVTENTDDSEIEALIEARQAARAAKNFAESDRIRDELSSMGIILEDTPGGVRWRRG